MSERDQITYMQVRIARKASEKLNLSIAEKALLFAQYQVFESIRDCFGMFHVEGDEAAWDEIVLYLNSRGHAYA